MNNIAHKMRTMDDEGWRIYHNGVNEVLSIGL